MGFFGWGVAVIKVDVTQCDAQKPEIKRSKCNIQIEIGFPRRQVSCSDDVGSIVINFQPSTRSFKSRSIITGTKRAVNGDFVHKYRLAVFVGFIEDVSDRVDRISSQCVEGCRDIGLSDQLCDVKFRLIHPLITNSVIGDINQGEVSSRTVIGSVILGEDGCRADMV